MEYKSYGFLIDGNIQFNISHKKLVFFLDEDDDHSLHFRVVSLNEMQSRLLSFLLKNRKNEIINKDSIMKNVWDEFGLSSSNQRLWQEIKKLRKKLSAIGLCDDFILNVHGIGYSIDDKRVESLFIQ